MDTWIIKSNPVKQFGSLTGIFLVGVALMIGFRDFDPSGLTLSLTGFLLGAFLMGTTLMGVFASFQQTVAVDPNTRQIVIKNATLKGMEEWIIPFAMIKSVHVVFLKGKSQSIRGIYYLSLTLNNGTHSQLFFPAYFDGRESESVANERLRRLEQYLQSNPSSQWPSL